MPGTSVRRYGWRHQQARRRLSPVVAAGGVVCTRCGEPIEPGQQWDLDHDDLDPRYYAGAAHRRCNRQTGKHYATRVVSRQWL